MPEDSERKSGGWQEAEAVVERRALGGLRKRKLARHLDPDLGAFEAESAEAAKKKDQALETGERIKPEYGDGRDSREGGKEKARAMVDETN